MHGPGPATPWFSLSTNAASRPRGARGTTVKHTEPDLVFVNGKIRTPVHPSGFVRALAVRHGVIQALGAPDHISPLTGRRTRVIDLRGRPTLPPFDDAHWTQ